MEQSIANDLNINFLSSQPINDYRESLESNLEISHLVGQACFSLFLTCYQSLDAQWPHNFAVMKLASFNSN